MHGATLNKGTVHRIADVGKKLELACRRRRALGCLCLSADPLVYASRLTGCIGIKLRRRRSLDLHSGQLAFFVGEIV